MASHDSQNVEQIRHGTRFTVTGLPQIENVFSRTSLGGKVVDVPVESITHTFIKIDKQ